MIEAAELSPLILSSPLFPFTSLFHVCMWMFLSLLGFPCFFLSPSLYLPLSLSFSGHADDTGAWPDKVIPQSRGLPGRDSLDTVSPLLARCRLQREGRPELESGGKKGKKKGGEGEVVKTRPEDGTNVQMQTEFQLYSICLMRLRREGTF